MPPLLACTPLFAAFAGVALAQPIVNAIENNYSYIPAGLPNYGIAQGSIFVIFGSNLAAAPSGLQALPLKSTVSGVSVQFGVQGATTQALLYYVMPNQIAGVLPSATPIGTGTVVVTSNGKSSAPAPITVVQSAIGILTGNGTGIGSAAAFDASWRPLGPANAANPGNVVVLFGSGAGPVSGDESVQQVPQNLSNVPLEVDIGGSLATVSYHGRSIYPGLDQINVEIPSGTVGCNVSVTALSGDLVSNFAYIPIAANSRVCSDQVLGVTLGPSIFLTGKSSYNIGNLTLEQHVVSNPAITSEGHVFPAEILTSVTGSGQFMQIASPQPGTLISSQLGETTVFPSIGNCGVVVYTIPIPTSAGIPAAGAIAPLPDLLNAGPALSFTGPNGKASVMFQAFQPGIYAGTLGASGSDTLPFIPSGGGLFTIDNSGGGPDIGPFSTQINLPPPLVWSNIDSITLVGRSQPLTITWTGGDPTGIVSIEGSSSITTPTQVVVAQLNCSAPVAARQFTIPASVLLALPPQPIPTGPGPNYAPTLQVTGGTNFLFTAPGLDGGLINAASVNNLTVPYQ